MPEHWQLAKRVLIWNADPPALAGGPPDATRALLVGIASAYRADQAAEVDRLCRRALRSSPDPFIPTMFLAARLVNAASGADEAEVLILQCGVQTSPERRAYAAALLALARAWRQQRASAEQCAAEALAALEDVEDDAFVGFIEMRLTLAAQLRGDLTSVQELADRAVSRLERAQAYALAANTLTFRYLPHLELGDIDAARALLARAAKLAALGDSPTTKRTIENISLAFAVTIGDEEEMRAHTAAPFAAHHAYDSFLIAIYLAMPAGWKSRWHDFLARVGGAEPVTRAQQALKDALIAVGSAATRDDAEARTRWRRAVHRLAHGSTWHLSDTRIRRLARALACTAGAAVGDIARANRAAAPLRGSRQLAVFTGAQEPTYAGFQRLVSAMRDARRALDPAVALTPAQASLLKALASDASIAEIARQDPQRRSVATIRSHVQRLYDALEVHSRTAAVLKAKELSLL